MTIAKAIEDLERLIAVPEVVSAEGWSAYQRSLRDWIVDHGPTILSALRAQGEPVAWAYYWPDGGLMAVHPYQLHGSKIAEHSFREVPLYAAPHAVPEGLGLRSVLELLDEAAAGLDDEPSSAEEIIAFIRHRVRLLAAAKEGSNGSD